MKILVTGGTGYIGSFVCKTLQEAGQEVVVLDNLAYGHREAITAPLEVGDLLDTEFVRGVLSRHNPDAVMHLAAWIEVGESVVKPAKYFANNTGGSAALLQAMADHGVEMLVFSSTAAVYGTPKQLPLTEQSETTPENPYGLSKLLTELSLPTYSAAYGMRFVTLRYFNAAGAAVDGSMGEAHEPATHLMTNALRGALGRQAFTLFGTDYETRDGTCVRDFIHVLDIASAHVAALNYLASGGGSQTFNVGTGHGFTNREVLDAVRRISGKDFTVTEGPRRPGDPATLVANATLLSHTLGWSPSHSDLETLVRSSWEWEVNHPNGYQS
jgi:UDP-glucose 4-epimerase